ncbi:MAG: sugar isomerase domain-containing protein [Terracidiphilus sp.]|nr:sugar isomerase domain-containing protein [Terracidiphilus sp.]
MDDSVLLTFPNQLDRIRDGVLAQAEILRQVARHYADAIQNDGLIHVYANGHSRIAVEEMVVRMGALTGFHPVLASALSNFSDVVGADSLRLNQAIEKVEGLGAVLLDEVEVGPHDVFVAVSATGQTQAAVDFALEVSRRYPEHPLVCIASKEQASTSAPKHSCGMTLWHVAEKQSRGYFLDNCMPLGDLSTPIEGQTGKYVVCPLSSIGALTIVQSLNELTLRELDRRGYKHLVLQNMHLGGYGVNYGEWLADQRRRYALALHRSDAVSPARSERAS